MENNQNPYEQIVGVQQPVEIQQPQKTEYYTPEEKAKAKLLCIISLILFVAPEAVSFLISLVRDMVFIPSSISTTTDVMENIILSLGMASLIAAYVLMIVARVKYPKYVFAKVLMWVYIALFIATVIAAIIGLVMLYIVCSSCAGMTGSSCG